MNRASFVGLGLLISVMAQPCLGETLALNKAFVDRYKNKATITVQMHVDAHPNQPHRISKGGDDGDIHMAGRADEVGLPLVAEIVNARLEPRALTALMQTSGAETVAISGAWRIWFEHLGKEDAIQGQPVPPPSTSNPDHLFEIHPITMFAGINVMTSFSEISGYQAYPAKVSFPFYENVSAAIESSDTAILVESGEAKYNYTEFEIEVEGSAEDVGDGYFVLAQVYDTEDPEQAMTGSPRRMVFVKGTAPADTLTRITKGDRLHVLGIPRVNLSEVDAIAAQTPGQTISTTLPYEMIIVAVLP